MDPSPVLPASAGMILGQANAHLLTSSAPRIRGDDPIDFSAMESIEECSPHPRG